VVIFWLVEIELVVGVVVFWLVEIKHIIGVVVFSCRNVEIKHAVAFVIFGSQQVEIEPRNIIGHLWLGEEKTKWRVVDARAGNEPFIEQLMSGKGA
jgi:hypothetical protein